MKTKTLLVAVVLLALASGLARGQTLGEALDAPQLTWTTGGAVPWFGQSATTLDGADAAECGGLTNAWSESWLQTTVTGRVAVLFWWKSVSPGGQFFGYYFETNDTYLDGLYGNVDWRPTAVSFAEGTNTLKWISSLAGLNPAAPIATNWLDLVVVTNIAGLQPTFLTQPESAVTMPENYLDQTNLQVRAIGDIPMTYQWQRNGTNLNEGWPYYGVETPSFRFYANTADDAGDYRVVLSNAWGIATSAVCSVSVVPAKPGFHPFQPADVVLAPGAYHSFNYVSILGTSPFTLLWFQDGNPIPSGNIGPATFADAGGYSLVANNAYRACTSRVAQLTVSTDLPTIVSEPNPQSTEARPGDSVQFSMQASGPEPLSYSWRKKGEGPELATMNWFGFDSADPTNTGYYYVIVTNNNGAVTSRVSVLAVAPVTALGLALDAPQLTVTNHYDGLKWRPDGNITNAHDGLCAARSPELYFGSSAFSTAVTGPTNVSFWWRISAIAAAHLDLSVDGSTEYTISGETAWAQQTLDLPAGEHMLTWTFRKDTAGSEGADAAWVDQFAFGGVPPSVGVEITNFITVGDSLPWHLQTTNTHDGVDAWQSGAITDDATNRLATTVTGPGTLSFWWMVSSEENSDFIEFRLDGILLTNLSGAVAWQSNAFALATGPHTLEWRYRKDGSGSDGADAGWVDEVFFTPTVIVDTTLTNALDAPTLVFTNGGSAPWFYQTTTSHDGADAARSGPIGDGEESWLETTVTGPGTLTFWWAVESQEGCDFLRVSVDEVAQTNIAGNVAWRQESLVLSAGSHTVRWRYVKDGSMAVPRDAGWLDEVTWTPAPPPTLAEGLDAPAYEFLVFDNAPLWFGQATNTYDGVDAVQSAVPPVRSQYWLYTTITGPGTLTFWGKISAASGDTLQFMLGSSSWSILYGDWDWRYFTYEIEPGPHTVGWAFWKDSEESAGLNAVFLDEITFTPRVAPTITTQPRPQWLHKGRSFQLSVAAVGEPPLQHQWLKDGAPITGTTEPLYAVGIASYDDTGSYRVVITNAHGAVTSNPVRVSVARRFYTVTDLGALPAPTGLIDSEAYAINNHGVVVGRSRAGNAGSDYHACYWPPGADRPEDLGDHREIGGQYAGYSYATAVNDNGVIVGGFEWRTNATLVGIGHAAVWTKQGEIYQMQDIHASISARDSIAMGISEAGHIIVESDFGIISAQRTWLTTMSSLGTPASLLSGYVRPAAVNRFGWLVGNCWESPNPATQRRPYFNDGTQAQCSAQVGAYVSINDVGVVAGYFNGSTNGFSVYNPFLRQRSGLIQNIPFPYGVQVKDLNNQSEVVGTSYALNGMLYTDGHWFRLDDLIPDTSGVSFLTANSINESGQIVGWGSYLNTDDWFAGRRACLLTPAGLGHNQRAVPVDDTITLRRPVRCLFSTDLLLANDSDPDGDPLYVTRVSDEGRTQNGGRAQALAGFIHYSPGSGTTGGDAFDYWVSDGRGNEVRAHVTLVFDPNAPNPPSTIVNPTVRPDGSVDLSGYAPPGSTVVVSQGTGSTSGYFLWGAGVAVVGDSGQWSANVPASSGGTGVGIFTVTVIPSGK